MGVQGGGCSGFWLGHWMASGIAYGGDVSGGGGQRTAAPSWTLHAGVCSPGHMVCAGLEPFQEEASEGRAAVCVQEVHKEGVSQCHTGRGPLAGGER